MSGGKKFDGDKTRWDLLPYPALEALAGVFTFGADKYGSRDWEGGIPYGRLFAAAQRHLSKWWCDDDFDEESNLHHLAHAGCCIVMLLQQELALESGTDLDDRPGHDLAMQTARCDNAKRKGRQPETNGDR
jgi:hypothetical protein